MNAENNIISGGKLIFDDGLLDLDQDASIASEIILNDNASMDLSSGKKLSVTKSFEVPANLKLEIVGNDGGSLSLSELNFDSLKPWNLIASLYKIPQESFVLITIHPETDSLTDFKNELNELNIVLKFLLKKYFYRHLFSLISSVHITYWMHHL